MFKEFFKLSELQSVPVFVMLFFIGIFTLVLFRIFSKKRRSHYDAMSRLPLETEGDA